MELNDIVFLEEDNDTTTAIKTVNLWVGTSELKPQLAKLGIDYVKVQRGLKVVYILRGKKIGKLEITL